MTASGRPWVSSTGTSGASFANAAAPSNRSRAKTSQMPRSRAISTSPAGEPSIASPATGRSAASSAANTPPREKPYASTASDRTPGVAATRSNHSTASPVQLATPGAPPDRP